jgi:hypothetical protein
LFAGFVLATMMKSRKATRRQRASKLQLLRPAARRNSNSEGSRTKDDQGDWSNQVSETQLELSLPDLPPAFSESVVPENAAQSDGERREATKPSKSYDEAELVNRLAQAIGAQEPAGSSPDLPSAVSESVVPENADKNREEQEIACAEQTQSGVRHDQDQSAEQRDNTHQVPS